MKFLTLLVCVFLLPVKTAALEIEAPPVPRAAAQWMPDQQDSFSEGISELVEKVVSCLRPDLGEAARAGAGVIGAVLLVGILTTLSGPVSKTAEVAGVVAIAAILLRSANSLIQLASGTVVETGEYGKLLLPVMATALAAQGGIGTSAGLYAITAMFTAVLQSIISSLLVPGIYLYLAIATGSAATGELLLKRLGDLVKGVLSWSLKTLLMIFTTYLSLTHVISGTTDGAALKAAKVTISTVVPVVGGVLSDASEAVLVSAGVMKNAAGIYGILAVLALCLHPFARIGLHYLVLKLTAAVCSVFGSSRIMGILDSFCTALGLLLGMTGAGCVMMLISTVCFMKGVG